MAEQIRALVVHRRDEVFKSLAVVLDRLGMDMVYAQNCREAGRLFKHEPVDIVFTGVDLQDGGWADMLVLSAQSRSYLPVVVMSQDVDIELYLEVIGSGAFDMIVPPFVTSDVAHIVRSAIYKELVSEKHNMSAQQAV